MEDELIRTEFESWLRDKRNLYPTRRDEAGYEDEYEHPFANGAWAAWKYLTVEEG